MAAQRDPRAATGSIRQPAPETYTSWWLRRIGVAANKMKEANRSSENQLQIHSPFDASFESNVAAQQVHFSTPSAFADDVYEFTTFMRLRSVARELAHTLVMVETLTKTLRDAIDIEDASVFQHRRRLEPVMDSAFKRFPECVKDLKQARKFSPPQASGTGGTGRAKCLLAGVGGFAWAMIKDLPDSPDSWSIAQPDDMANAETLSKIINWWTKRSGDELLVMHSHLTKIWQLAASKKQWAEVYFGSYGGLAFEQSRD